jgi:RHS repeat-associated protein
VKATLGTTTTVYIGNYYEQSGSLTTTYYYAGGTRIAMRQGSTVNYLLGDHLGSTSITANSSGGLFAELRYKPWGEERYTNGVTTPTRRQYTGQIKDAEIGLYFYNARYYSSALGRFLSADTLVPSPSDPQSWNRFSYVRNQPLKYIDPSGHGECDPLNGKCEGGPNTSGGKDGGGGGGGKPPIEPVKPTGEQNGPFQKVYRDASGRLVRIDYKGTAYIDGVKTKEPICPDCGTSNPTLLRSEGAIIGKQQIKPDNVGQDGLSASCQTCGTSSGVVKPGTKHYPLSINRVREFAEEIGLDPNQAAVYTPQFGQGKPGHWSLFVDAFGSDGIIMQKFATKILDFFKAIPKIRIP